MSASNPTIATSGSERFVFIDALRGIACIGVVFHHMLNNTVMCDTFKRVFAGWFVELCELGAYGVEIFFVISGFVIAHSTRKLPLTREGLTNFIVRRQVRLDPAFWSAIALAILLLGAEKLVPGTVMKPFPSIPEIVANLFYLQRILGVQELVEVAWTLCIEIQFYLVFILFMFALRRQIVAENPNPVEIVAPAFLWISGVASLWLRSVSGEAWFLPFWFFFAMGVMVYWTYRGAVHPAWFLTLAVIALVAWPFAGSLRDLTHFAATVGVITAVAVYWVGLRGGLTRWLNQPWFQYLGRISYSLYLVHLLVLSVVLRGGYKLTGESAIGAYFWFPFAVALCIGAGELLYRAVERPSMLLASSLKRGGAGSAEGRQPLPAAATSEA